MGKLTFDISMSLDGFIAGPNMAPDLGLAEGGGGGGRWGEEETWGDWGGWWGDEPPFFKPVFVLTHHEREPLVKGQTTFTFVTDGIESALEQAQAAAGDGDVAIGGGASVIQQ